MIAFLDRLLETDALDAADKRLATMLRALAKPADGAEDEAFIAVVVALLRACAEGSLCLPLEERALGAALRRLLSAGVSSRDDTASASAPTFDSTSDPEALAKNFLSAADAGRFAAALGTPAAPRPLIRAHDNLYLHRFWFAGKTIAEDLAARNARADAAPPPETLDAILKETLEDNPLRAAGGDALRLVERQREALAAALRSPVFVLSGGPGTGKTTWTAAWLRAVLRLETHLNGRPPGDAAERVRLCAPTGRAARRLEESLRAGLAGVGDHSADAAARTVPVTTLHTLLGYRAFEGRFARGPGDPVDADWILLDEASMADVFLMAALVRALRPGARLVLCGDPGQLPAVEAGSVLAELLPEPGKTRGPLPSVTLDAGHRARGAVAALAEAVRDGDVDATLNILGAPVAAEEAFAPTRSVARLATDTPAEALRAYATAVFGEARDGGGYAALLNRFRILTRAEETTALDALWERAGRARVLAPLRRGPVSAGRANALLRDLLEPVWRRPRDARGVGFHGAPMLITRNDDRTGLSNGDVGLWLETADGAAVFFPRPELPGGWLRLPAALLPPHELGFASTVHKSQGSEYDAVLVLLPEPGNPLLARETLYTAITRARTAARIFGREESICEAVERKLERYEGLRKMMEG